MCVRAVFRAVLSVGSRQKSRGVGIHSVFLLDEKRKKNYGSSDGEEPLLLRLGEHGPCCPAKVRSPPHRQLFAARLAPSRLSSLFASCGASSLSVRSRPTGHPELQLTLFHRGMKSPCAVAASRHRQQHHPPWPKLPGSWTGGPAGAARRCHA